MEPRGPQWNYPQGIAQDTPQVNRLGLCHVASAFLGVAGDAVGQADLHVQRDALQLHRVQVVDQRGRYCGVAEQRFPQGHARG
ncbi:hypothetical protein D3C72_1772280 [compost metagenome]